jgi:hypothetical protein
MTTGGSTFSGRRDDSKKLSLPDKYYPYFITPAFLPGLQPVVNTLWVISLFFIKWFPGKSCSNIGGKKAFSSISQ